MAKTLPLKGTGRVRFVPNKEGIRKLAGTPAMEGALRVYAEEAVEVAQNLAQAEAYDTGAYMESIEADSANPLTDRRRTKAVARVNAHDFKAHWIEFGAGPSPVRGGRSFPARAILRRAVEAIGLRLARSRSRDDR